MVSFACDAGFGPCCETLKNPAFDGGEFLDALQDFRVCAGIYTSS